MLAMRKMHKNQAFSIAAVLVMSLLAIYVIFDPFHAGWSVPPFHPPVTHTVLFQFKQDANEDAIRNACSRMMSLQDACINPSSLKPYIKYMVGGRDVSPEGRQNGATHGFVVKFASTQDRDYYVEKDPAHQAFKESMLELVEKSIVVDFEDNRF